MSAFANIPLAAKNWILGETLPQPCPLSFSRLTQPTSVLTAQVENCIFRHTITDARKSYSSSLLGPLGAQNIENTVVPTTLVQNKDNFSGLNKNEAAQSERIHTYTEIKAAVFQIFLLSSLPFSPTFCLLGYPALVGAEIFEDH